MKGLYIYTGFTIHQGIIYESNKHFLSIKPRHLAQQFIGSVDAEAWSEGFGEEKSGGHQLRVVYPPGN